MASKFKYNCPSLNCSTVINYCNKNDYERSLNIGRLCDQCIINSNPERFIESSLVRICPNPECCNKVEYIDRFNWIKAIKKDANCRLCTRKGTVGWSKGLTKETDERVANVSIGIIKTLQQNKENGIERVVWCRGLTKETDDRLKFRKENPAEWKPGNIPWNLGLAWEDRENPPPFLGRKHSDETKDKIRIKRTERFVSQDIGPAFNKSTVELFKKLNEELNFNGIYATNPKEFYIKGLGYWVDYYEPFQNLVIEFYEIHHRQKKKAKRDLIRMEKIINKLN